MSWDPVRLTEPQTSQGDICHLLDLLVQLYEDNHGLFLRCLEIQAAYTEILNLVSGFEGDTLASTIDTDSVERGPQVKFSATGPVRGALLENQLTVQKVYQSRETGDIRRLISEMNDIASPEAAVGMLEAIPRVYQGELDTKVAEVLCRLFLVASSGGGSLESRAVAMENLAERMDSLIQRGSQHATPFPSDLARVLVQSAEEPMNASLSNALIRLSGCIMATNLWMPNPSCQVDVTNWTAMIADAAHEDQVQASPFPPSLFPPSPIISLLFASR